MYEELKIGEKIKNLRTQLNLTQQDLADRTELTKGYISQLERDLTVPSIPTLSDILKCLGVSMADFFKEEKTEQIVFTASDCCEKTDEKLGNVVRWLVPSAQLNMQEPILVTFEPGGRTEEDKPHEGEEFGFVLSGAIRLTIGGKSYPVRKGESFYFVSKEPHTISNASTKNGASFLWIATPPTF